MKRQLVEYRNIFSNKIVLQIHVVVKLTEENGIYSKRNKPLEFCETCDLYFEVYILGKSINSRTIQKITLGKLLFCCFVSFPVSGMEFVFGIFHGIRDCIDKFGVESSESMSLNLVSGTLFENFNLSDS